MENRRHSSRGDREDQGFTLIELLIVIVVLGVLAATVVFALSKVDSQAATAACDSDASTIQTAATAYSTQHPGSQATSPLQLQQDGYLHNVPSNPDYAITISNGNVMVAVPATSTNPVAFNSTPNPCDGAGAPNQQAAAPANAQAATTTSTTAVAPSTTTSTAPHPTTTTTVAPTTTTTTAPVSNGVTATPTTNTYGGYGGQDLLAVSNSRSITAMTITIAVAQTTGVTANGGYNSFPGGIATQTYGSSGNGMFTSTYVLNSGQSIPSGSPSGSFVAQYGGTGSARVQTGDTWKVVSTSNGVTSTISGHF